MQVIPEEFETYSCLAAPAFSYRAYGLNIHSELECSGVSPGSGVPDVHVRLGPVTAQLDNPVASGVFYQATRERLLLNVKHIARYLVSAGNEIVVEVMPGADSDMIRLLLMGSAFGALLHQRGVFAVHGSAIATRRGAVVFAGDSGYGKSTLAGAFHQRGFPVLADDVCPIDTTALPIVLPANPFLTLWADAANRLGMNPQHLRRARSGLEKYILPLGEGFAAEPAPLHAIYVLELSNSDEFSIVPLQGLQKIKALNLATYRPHFFTGVNPGRIRQIGEVARQAKVAVVTRPRNGFRVDELTDLLAADFAP